MGIDVKGVVGLAIQFAEPPEPLKPQRQPPSRLNSSSSRTHLPRVS